MRRRSMCTISLRTMTSIVNVITLVHLLGFTFTHGQTEGGNSDGFPCYFPFMYEGIMYATCIDINHKKPWCSTTINYDIDRRWGECMAEDLSTLPNFDTSTPTNLTVYQGDTARLMCSVNNLQDKKVTWQRKGSAYPLTVSTFSFLSSGRFIVEHDEESEWNMLIKGAKRSDSGIYECRVTTQTMMLVREVHLTVQDKQPTKPPAALTLGDNSIIYVTKGEELMLQCNTTTTSTLPSPRLKVIPPEVEWFTGDGNLIDSHSLNRIVITNQVNEKYRISTLIIDKVEAGDAGVYICRNTERYNAEVTVRVLNVDRDNKKRGTNSQASPQLDPLTGRDNSSTTLILPSCLLILCLIFVNLT